jgi:hypothetical protein
MNQFEKVSLILVIAFTVGFGIAAMTSKKENKTKEQKIIRNQRNTIIKLKKELKETKTQVVLSPEVKALSKFKTRECIYGSSGDEKVGHASDAGYQIIKVDLETDQYLLKCVEKSDCINGLKTWWISQFDKYMLKVACSKLGL